MRGPPRASDKSAPRVLLALCALLAVSCSHAAPRRARPPEPPPRVLVVGLEQVALRTSAWVELHAALAHTARAGQSAGDADLDQAARAYAGILAEDERDELLARTTTALEACDDERCARAAVTGTPFAAPYLAALPDFLERHWTERATRARAAIEVTRSSLPGEELEPLVAKLARDLAMEWPPAAPVVDIVAEAPEPGREAPVRVLLAARGSCFLGERGEPERVHDARILDCVLTYALLRMSERSAIGQALGANAGRAWAAIVIHAVASLVTAWEPRHVSVLRRSAVAVMPRAMEWLAHEWPARLRGEAPAELARRFAAARGDGAGTGIELP